MFTISESSYKFLYTGNIEIVIRNITTSLNKAGFSIVNRKVGIGNPTLKKF